MKMIFAMMVLGLTMTAFADEEQPTFINLPGVSLEVVTKVRGNQRSGPPHLKAQEATLEKLRLYVETTLGRQPINSSCKSGQTYGTMSADSFMTSRSICTVTFL